MNLKQILKLPTPRLLAYYKKYYRHTRNPFTNHWDGEVNDYSTQEQVDSWRACRDAIKLELSMREHVE